MEIYVILAFCALFLITEYLKCKYDDKTDCEE